MTNKIARLAAHSGPSPVKRRYRYVGFFTDLAFTPFFKESILLNVM